MKLFSEKVNPTFTSSTLNILTVKNFNEVFFDVYEFEINGKKFTAEKIAENNNNPVVNIPIVIGKEEFVAPFVLKRGSFLIEFNKDNKTYIGNTSVDISKPDIHIVEEKFEELDTLPNLFLEDLSKEKKASKMIFDEEAEVIVTDIDHNILVTENYKEVFFDVFEIEVNGKKYNAEKVSTYKNRPVVSVPVVFENKEYIAPFVLEKGKQEILFNKNNLEFIKEVEEEEFILPVVEEETVEDIVIEKKESILKDIVKAKKIAKQYAEDIKLKKIKEANNIISKNEKKIHLYIEDVKDNLTNQFLSILDKTNSKLLLNSKQYKNDLTLYIKNYVKDESKNLLENLESLNNKSIIIFEDKIQDLLKNVYTKNLTNLVNEKSENNVAQYSKIFNETKISLEQLLKDNKSNIDQSLENFKTKINNDIIVLEKSNIDLDDKFNKGLNKALSRVGNIKIETLKEVDSRIKNTEDKITDIYEITLDDVKKELEKSESDFSHVNEKIKKLTTKSLNIENSTSSELSDIKSDIVKLKVEKGELEQRILENKELLEENIKKITKLNKDVVQENKYYLQKEVDKLQEKTQFYSDKANKNNLKNNRLISEFTEDVSNKLSKTNKDVSSKLSETKLFFSEEIKSIDSSVRKDLIKNIDSKLKTTNKEIDIILAERIQRIDSKFRKELKDKITENKVELNKIVEEIKNSIPKSIEKEIVVENNKLPDKNYKLEIQKLEKRILDKFTNEISSVRRYLDMYGGGGGSVAVQNFDGGEVNGNLLPAENNTYNLGSATNRWKDLFISGDTIDIGGTKLKIVDNALKVEDEDNNDASITVQNLSASNLILSGGRDLADIFATSAEAGINQIIAGTGLTGGGTSDTVTLNVSAGDGITATANCITVDNTVLRTTGAQSVGLSATSTNNGFVSAGRDLSEIFSVPTAKIIGVCGVGDFSTIDTIPFSCQSSTKYAIAVSDDTGGVQFSELAITTDGSNIGLVEYGINSTSTDPFVEYGAIVQSGNLSLTAKGVGGSLMSNFTFKGNRTNLFS